MLDINPLLDDGFSASIAGVTVTGGNVGISYGGGGIIYGEANGGSPGTLTINNCVITANTATGGPGGGIEVSTSGSLVVTDSTISNNTASDAAAGQGGGVDFFIQGGAGNLTLTRCTVSGNRAGANGGAGGGLLLTSKTGSTFTLDQCQLLNNAAFAALGKGGALAVGGGALTAIYCRILGNSADSGVGSAVFDESTGTATVNDNWWGINTGPPAGALAQNPGSPAPVATTWLQLRDTASPSTIAVNQSASLTASFLANSANTPIAAANLTALVGLPVTWSAVGGSISGAQTTIQSAGTATATYNETSGVAGTHSATSVVDNGPASGSVNTVSLTVNKANTTAAFISDVPDASLHGQPVTVSYSVTGASGNSPTVPTGNVLVSDGVNSASGTVADGSAAVALFTTGVRTLTATYQGDANFNASPASTGAGHQVNQANTTSTITSHTPDPSDVGQAVTVNFTVVANAPGAGTPTGNVTVSDGVNSVVATVAAGTGSLTLNTSGNRTLTATYAGDADFNGSTSAGVAHTVNAPAAPDYTVTTIGNVIVVTDLAGNGDTLTVSEPSPTNIKFAAPGRTFSVNGVLFITGDSGDLPLVGVTSITVNAQVGNDILNVGAFTGPLPSLTFNGGPGDDRVSFNGDLTFAAGASLDVDLQNDDPTPGVDTVNLAVNANLKVSGTGTITVTCSRDVVLSGGSSLETVDGNLTVEANQQATPTAGNFHGVFVNGGLIQVTGSGGVMVKGKGGNDAAGNQWGVGVTSGGDVIGGTSGLLTVQGTGGASSGDRNHGVAVVNPGSTIASSGGNVQVTGLAGGSGASGINIAVWSGGAGQVSAGGSGTVTVQGTSGPGAGSHNLGVAFTDAGSTITSGGGNVQVIGIEGAGSNGTAIWGQPSAAITTAANGGALTLIGNSMVLFSGATISGQVGGSVTLRPFTSGAGINLGASSNPTGGPLSLTDDELDQITCGTLIIGDAASGDITVSGAISPANAGALNLVTGGSIRDTYAGVPDVTIASLTTSGNLSPGASPGLFSVVGNHTLADNSTFTVEIGGTVPGTGYDQLSATGNVDIGANVTLSAVSFGGFTPAAGNTFTIISRAGGSGAFAGLPEGATVTVAGVPLKITYVGGAGSDVVLLAPTFSLGNRVFADNGAGGGLANNGVQDGTEPGIQNVVVNLYLADPDGAPTGLVLDTETTDADGWYRFDGVAAGRYVVVVDMAGSGAALTGLMSSIGASANFNLPGDLRDHGLDTPLGGASVLPGGIASAAVEVGTGLQPTGEATGAGAGANGLSGDVGDNLVADFGFTCATYVDGYVFVDFTRDGQWKPANDTPLPGITVWVTNSQGGVVSVLTDLDGYYRANVTAGSTVVRVDTNSAGFTAGYVLTDNTFGQGEDPTTVNVAPCGSAQDNTGFRNPAPTLASILSVAARANAGQVTVRWVTATELGTVSYNLQRQLPDGAWTTVNADPVFAWNSVLGASYEVADTGARARQTYQYQIAEYLDSGETKLHGPYAVMVTGEPGVPVAITSCTLEHGQLRLTWVGGAGSYLLERSLRLGADSDWVEAPLNDAGGHKCPDAAGGRERLLPGVPAGISRDEKFDSPLRAGAARCPPVPSAGDNLSAGLPDGRRGVVQNLRKPTWGGGIQHRRSRLPAPSTRPGRPRGGGPAKEFKRVATAMQAQQRNERNEVR